MVDRNHALLLVEAKKQLGLRANAADKRVSDVYLEELRSHLKLYPLENEFRVTLQPKKGYGVITCMKQGCGEAIQLDRRVKCEDGGKKDGLGSFSAFWTHLSSHLLLETRVRTRRSDRNASGPAIKAESHDVPLPSLRTARSLNRLASSSRSKIASSTQATSATAKLESVDAAIPRKRESEHLSAQQDQDQDTDSNKSSQPPTKKVKTEPVPKQPLASVTNTAAALSSANNSISMNMHLELQREEKKVVIGAEMAISERLPPVTQPTPQLGGSNNRYSTQVAMPTQRPALSFGHIERTSGSNGGTIPGPSQSKVDVKRDILQVAQPSQTALNPSQVQRRTSVALRPFPMDIYGTDALDEKPLNHSGRPVALANSSQHFGQMASSSITPRPIDSKAHIRPELNMPFIQYNPVPSSSRHMMPPPNTFRVKEEPSVQPSSLYANVASSSRHVVPHFGVGQHGGQRDVKPTIAQNTVASGSNVALRGSSPLGKKRLTLPGAYMDSEDERSDYSESPAPELDYIYQQIGIRMPLPMSDDVHDDNGDFHGRGRDLYVGPQAVNDDIEKFIVEAGNAESFDGNETVDKALDYLGLKHLDEKLPGMDISLMPHQAMGVAWMLEKEKSGIKGGCLADEMGLGKTVQMITCMVKNRSTNPSCKTNLIVAPLALLNQWKQEIEDKTNCGLTCIVYHGPSRTRSRTELSKYDVVLTTFNTMAMEWPDYENEMKKKAKAKKRKDDFIVDDSDAEDMRNAQYRSEKRKKHSGLLFQMSFYRIVADEGQQIRNRRTRMSRAITELQAEYRWLLTGTPIVNSLSDAYGYIRFLKIRPWYDWQEFHHEIGMLEKKRPSVAVARLQKVMNTFLLRRKKDSKLDGKNLIDLPPKEIILRRLEFSQEERDIYSMVEARSQAKFNRYLREGTVLKNYHQVLVLLLRLRQICSHPSLIQEEAVTFVRPDEANVKAEFATELTRARRLVSSEFVERMIAKFKEQSSTRMEAERQSTNATIEEDECPICYDAMTEAVVTPCTHIFCRDCIVDVINRAPPMEAGDQAPGANADVRACPVCRAGVSMDKLFSRDVFEVANENDTSNEDEDAMDTEEDYYPGKGKRPSKAVARKSKKTARRGKNDSDDDYGSEEDDDGSDMSDFIVESDEDEEEKDARRAMKKRQKKANKHIIMDSDDEPDTPEEQEVIFGLQKKVPQTTDVVPIMSRFLPSTKMKFMMDQLKKLQQSNPDEKTLIVSQWTGCLSLISDYLTENGIPHVKYQGDMNRAKRDQAVQVFMSKEKARIMLMSLKCGGVGLNLTRANNVISLDLGWSQAVEAQAYDRVHRLGQTRKVTVERIVIADTVEDRILALQQRKQALADGSLGEGTGQKIGKLSVKELANLFGLDARGRALKLT